MAVNSDPSLTNQLAETGLRLVKPNVALHLEHFRSSQWLGAEELRALSWGRLKDTLQYSYTHVPFYRERFKRCGLQPQDVRNESDLAALPLTTKQDVREATAGKKPLLNEASSGRITLLRTTGSSGQPFIIAIDRDGEDQRLAMQFRNIEWYGHRLGDRNAQLWGQGHEKQMGGYLENRLRLISARFHSRVLGRRLEIATSDDYLPEESALDEARLEGWCERIRKYRPKVIDGYVSALSLLAKYIKARGITDIGCQAVATGAEYLSDENRKLIEEAFNCAVFNRYGCTEAGVIAHECGLHPGHMLHANVETVYFEVVKNGNPVNPGERGEVVVTDFTNRAFPLIRYRLNDIAVAASPNETCPCGRGLPLMGGIEGRLDDLIVLPNNKAIDPHLWVWIFSSADFVHQYQITQQARDLVRVDLILREGAQPGEYDVLRQRIERFLQGCSVRWNVVQSIPPGPGGKVRQTISNIPSSELLQTLNSKNAAELNAADARGLLR